MSELYPPDGSINGRRLHAVAVGLRASGVDVAVITSHPHYRTGRPEEGSSEREIRDGVPIKRLRTFGFGKQSLRARGVTAVLFALVAFVAVLFSQRRPGVVLSMSPSLFTGAAAALAARLRGAEFVYDIEDFHPDVAIEVGAVNSRPLIAALRLLELIVLRLSSHIVVISDGFRGIAIERGVKPDRVSVIPNWADPQFFDVPTPTNDLGVGAIFIGTHGLAQDLDVLVDAARLCPDVSFTFVGDGVAKPRAVERAKDLRNVAFRASQTHESVAATLATAHVALVALRPGRTLSVTVPSKTYEYLAAARPVLAVAGGDVAKVIDGAGICLPQGSDAAGVAEALGRLVEPERRIRMGERARELAREFARDVVVPRYVALLDHLR